VQVFKVGKNSTRNSQAKYKVKDELQQKIIASTTSGQQFGSNNQTRGKKKCRKMMDTGQYLNFVKIAVAEPKLSCLGIQPNLK